MTRSTRSFLSLTIWSVVAALAMILPALARDFR
jgi:hypothetical protein